MKKLIGVVSILVISVLGLSACSTNNEKVKRKNNQLLQKKKKTAFYLLAMSMCIKTSRIM